MGVEKRHVARGGKIYFSERGGINIVVFGQKYRPLQEQMAIFHVYQEQMTIFH
jgi:hypothetical protein